MNHSLLGVYPIEGGSISEKLRIVLRIVLRSATGDHAKGKIPGWVGGYYGDHSKRLVLNGLPLSS